MEALVLKGKEGLKYIIDNGTPSWLYTSMNDVEAHFILGLTQLFETAYKSGMYKGGDITTGEEGNVSFGAVYNKAKAKIHHMVVECFGQATITEGFRHNERDVFIEVNGEEKQFKSIGGQFRVNVEIKCISTTRKSVCALIDTVLVGLQMGDLDNYLAHVGINIPANSVSFNGRINRVPIVSDTALWEGIVFVDSIVLDWEQLLERNGEILKDYNYYLNIYNES